MAIDARIPLAGNSILGISEGSQNALLRGANFAQSQEERPVRNQILQNQARLGEQSVEQNDRAAQGDQIKRQYLAGKIMLQGVEEMKAMPVGQRRAYADRIKETLIAQGFDDIAAQAQLPEIITDQDIAGAESNLRPFVTGYESTLSSNQTPSGLREFNALTEGLSPEDLERARRVELGLEARAGSSARERIALDPNLTTSVAESEGTISGAKAGAAEDAKLDAQARKLPDIRAAIKTAEMEAKEKGEKLSDLRAAEAALPGLKTVVERLKELAPIATHTYSGKAFNALAKELGFGATKGATARAAFIATVRNQVLPLLRQTFGAAFTAAEGEKLESAFADPDASPEEKIAQLESFMSQKQRDIKAKQGEIADLTGEDLSTISDEDLLKGF